MVVMGAPEWWLVSGDWWLVVVCLAALYHCSFRVLSVWSKKIASAIPQPVTSHKPPVTL
jgi:hypothetical protein